MALAAFDTLKFANRLKSVGVPLAQAEAEAEVLAEIFEVNLRDLATKEDLQREIGDLRKDMDAKHESLRKDMDAKHESLRHEIGDLRKDMDAKSADVNAKFAAVDAKLEKLFLRLVIWLGSIVFLVVNTGPILPKLLHLT